jgi:predicted anti-sigma-YlaC factor YlaD
MNCTDARHLIHLDVGDDLRTEEEQQLAGHMEICSECRAYHAGMSRAMSALLVLRDSPTIATERDRSAGSAWPAVSREMQKRRTSPERARKFNLQVAALSVCSLSLAVVTIVQTLAAMRSSVSPSSFVPAQSVSSQLNTHGDSQYWGHNWRSGDDQQSGQGIPSQTNAQSSLPQSF